MVPSSQPAMARPSPFPSAPRSGGGGEGGGECSCRGSRHDVSKQRRASGRSRRSGTDVGAGADGADGAAARRVARTLVPSERAPSPGEPDAAGDRPRSGPRRSPPLPLPPSPPSLPSRALLAPLTPPLLSLRLAPACSSSPRPPPSPPRTHVGSRVVGHASIPGCSAARAGGAARRHRVLPAAAE